MSKNRIGFNRDTSDDDQEDLLPAVSSEETALILTELIKRLWCPVNVFAASDKQLTTEQVEEILQVNSSCSFTRADVTAVFKVLGFIQAPAGDNLYWLLGNKK